MKKQMCTWGCLLLLSFGAHAQALTAAVQERLASDPVVPAQRIELSEAGGAVTLRGEAGALLVKERAGLLAETVPGVRSVINNIHLNVDDRDDGAIERDVRQALASDPATADLGLEAEVDDALVTVTGEVDSWPRQELALGLVKAVRGVVGVDSRLRVRSPARPDPELVAAVEQALRWDALVRAPLLTVRATGGDVHLGGNVATAAERRRAVALAWSAGAQRVFTDGLQVSAVPAASPAQPEDGQIRQAVQNALGMQPRLADQPVKVQVKDGEVALSGTVGSLAARLAAARTARDIVGVRALSNRLQVQPQASPADPALARNVLAALRRHALLPDNAPTPRVEQGRVQLVGEVADPLRKAIAEEVVARVRGVVALDNQLAVAEPAVGLALNPYVDPIRVEDLAWYVPEEAPTMAAEAPHEDPQGG